MSAIRSKVAGPAYLQKPDKTHPIPTSSVAPDVVPNRASITKPKSKPIKLKVHVPDTQQEPEAQSMEEQLKMMDRLVATQDLVKIDYWSQPVGLFDLHIPRWSSPRQNASVWDHVKTIWNTQMNWVRNVAGMWAMASANSFPDVKVKSRWSPELFKVQSSPWLAGFRKMALQTYKETNNALASRDEKTLKKLTGGNYASHMMTLLRAQDRSRVYVWNLIKEETPCKVLSIRAPVAYYAPDEPKIGNRLLVQALVKFDTLQTLQVYNKKGFLVGGDESPRRVVQYLVFQKRMWYDNPWVIRDELFDSLEGKYTPIR